MTMIKEWSKSELSLAMTSISIQQASRYDNSSIQQTNPLADGLDGFDAGCLRMARIEQSASTPLTKGFATIDRYQEPLSRGPIL